MIVCHSGSTLNLKTRLQITCANPSSERNSLPKTSTKLFWALMTNGTEKHIKIRLYNCRLVAKSCLTLLRPHGLLPKRLLFPWDFSSKNTGVGVCFPLQGTFPTPGSRTCWIFCRRILSHWATREAQGSIESLFWSNPHVPTKYESMASVVKQIWKPLS